MGLKFFSHYQNNSSVFVVENLENPYDQAEENTNHVFSHSRQPFVPPVSSLHEHGFAKLWFVKQSIDSGYVYLRLCYWCPCSKVAQWQWWPFCVQEGWKELPFGNHDRYLSHHPFELSPTWTSLYQARPGPLPTVSSARDTITYIIISISLLLPIVYVCDTAWRVRHI